MIGGVFTWEVDNAPNVAQDRLQAPMARP